MPKKYHKIKRKIHSSVKKSKNSPKKSSWTHYFTGILGILSVIVITAALFYKAPIPCANSISCTKSLALQVENNETGTFLGKIVYPPKIDLSKELTRKPVLGAASGPVKIIYVDLSTQTLFAYEGDKLIYIYPISSGKWHRTPTGVFRIYTKLRSTRMTGGDPAIGTYYDLPNVEYTMYFFHDYAIHTAYWHDNFGYPMSHGCINERKEDAKKLYDWAGPQTTGYTTNATADNPGTEVVVYGQIPTE